MRLHRKWRKKPEHNIAYTNAFFILLCYSRNGTKIVANAFDSRCVCVPFERKCYCYFRKQRKKRKEKAARQRKEEEKTDTISSQFATKLTIRREEEKNSGEHNESPMAEENSSVQKETVSHPLIFDKHSQTHTHFCDISLQTIAISSIKCNCAPEFFVCSLFSHRHSAAKHEEVRSNILVNV